MTLRRDYAVQACSSKIEPTWLIWRFGDVYVLLPLCVPVAKLKLPRTFSPAHVTVFSLANCLSASKYALHARILKIHPTDVHVRVFLDIISGRGRGWMQLSVKEKRLNLFCQFSDEDEKLNKTDHAHWLTSLYFLLVLEMTFTRGGLSQHHQRRNIVMFQG